MINRVGYACINEHLRPRTFKTCRLKSIYKYGIEYLRNITIENLNFLYDIILWNMDNNITLYRVPSDIIPFSTHPEVIQDFSWYWKSDLDILNSLGKIERIVSANNLRITMHPDQFTVINSINNHVVENSKVFLEYHADLLDCIGGSDIVIHVGGVYNDKDLAKKRFIETYEKLDLKIKRYLRIENDDKSYNINDVLEISKKIHIPVIFDFHHYRCLNQGIITESEIIDIMRSWENTGLSPKIHLSSGKEYLKDRKHSDYINLEDLTLVESMFKQHEIDLMVEAKKKDFAALAVLNGLRGDGVYG